MKKVVNQLIKIANELDARGLTKEADQIDVLIRTAADLDFYMDQGLFSNPATGTPPRVSNVYNKSNKRILNDLSDLLESFEEYKPKSAHTDGPLGWSPVDSGGNLTICGEALSTMLSQAAKNEEQIPDEVKAMIQSLDFIKNPNKLFIIKAGLWAISKILDPPWYKWLSPAAVAADTLIDQEAKVWKILTKMFSPHYAEIQAACPMIDAAFAAGRAGVKGRIGEGVERFKGLFRKER